MKQIFWFYLEEFYFMKITFYVIIIFCGAGGKYFSALQVILFFKEKEYNRNKKGVLFSGSHSFWWKMFLLVGTVPFNVGHSFPMEAALFSESHSLLVEVASFSGNLSL